MIKTDSVSASRASMIPPDLNTFLPNRQTPWNVSSQLFDRIMSQNSDQPFSTCEVLSSDPEFNFILRYFEHQKPSGYGIKRIVYIYNPDHIQTFEGTFKNMEREANNPIFAPRGKEEEPRTERTRVIARWKKQAVQFSPVEVKSSRSRGWDACSKAKVFPLWSGGSPENTESICSSGFTYFGKHHYFHESAHRGNNTSTDKGYFGSGIYFTNSARYAAIFSNGRLLLSWVSMREPYPVVNTCLILNEVQICKNFQDIHITKTTMLILLLSHQSDLKIPNVWSIILAIKISLQSGTSSLFFKCHKPF